MNFLVLNIPSKKKIVRKFSCSYRVRNFLYPPLELVRVASIIKNNRKNENNVIFFDAVAKKSNQEECFRLIENGKAEVLILLASVDFTEEDYSFCCEVKKKFDVKILLIGYIPSLLPDKYSEADVVLGSSFEQVIKSACDKEFNTPEDFLDNIKKGQQAVEGFDPDVIDYHDENIFNYNDYKEAMVSGKTAYTYFSFGCPYNCNFCIKTYGLDALYVRNSECVLKELLNYHNKGYQNIRILDDNCTIYKDLLEKIDFFQKEKGISFSYYGLSRIELLDEDMINLLSEIGFKRIMTGIESLNKKSQDSYNKNINLPDHEIEKKVFLLRNKGIDVFMFIIINPLTDSLWDTVRCSLRLRRMKPDLISVNFMIPYPNTVFFNSGDNRRAETEYFFRKHILRFLFLTIFYFANKQSLFFLLKKIKK